MTMAAASRSTSDLVAENGGRRKSASSASGRSKMNALNPTFGMTSNTDAGSSRSPPSLTSHDRRPSRDTLRPTVARGHKSSDRLHRLGGTTSASSSHLASKRSKSQTQLTSLTSSTTKTKKKNRRSQRADSDEDEGQGEVAEEEDGGAGGDADEDGWTSASVAGTPDQSLQSSPKGSDEEDEDGGVVLRMDSKKQKKKKAGHSSTAAPLQLDTNTQPPQETESSNLLATTSQPAMEDPKTPTAASHPPLPRPALTSRADSEATLAQETRREDEQQQHQMTSPPGENQDAGQEYLAPLGRERQQRPSSIHTAHRMATNASDRTLTDAATGSGSGFYAGTRGVSSTSIASRMSTRSRTTSLLPQVQAAAPPMLNTYNALTGALGSLQEGQDPMQLSQSPSASYFASASSGSRGHTRDSFPSWGDGPEGEGARRKASISSQTSYRTLPTLKEAKSGSQTEDSHDAMLSPAGWENRRLQSSQGHSGHQHNSLTAADAAKLAAKLRQARDAMNDPHGVRSGLGGLSKGGTSALGNTTMDGKYTKPVISTFAKDPERKWSPHAVPVTHRSVYAPGYTKIQSRSAQAPVKGKNSTRYIRYVARYGLGGPPIAQTTLNEALLAPSFDGDEFEASWAPALTNAAGLGSRGTRHGGGHSSSSSNFREDGIPLHDPGLAFTGSAAVNGPNATPVHLIHGLTTISPDPFPLDPADAPSLTVEQPHGLTADPGTLRAIALTSQMLSAHRSHTMTRRYFDPMREGLGRIATYKGTSGSGSGPSGGHTGVATPPFGSHGTWSGNSLRRQNTSGRGGVLPSAISSHYPSFGEATEKPAQTLRTVWSGKGSLKGAAGMTAATSSSSAAGSGRSVR